ncbi:MAG: hypothetical protein AAGA40_02220 [Cyanobacteria bacterium P01_E01_bin.45]
MALQETTTGCGGTPLTPREMGASEDDGEGDGSGTHRGQRVLGTVAAIRISKPKVKIGT